MGALSPTHWLIIIGVLVVLFGAKRLPDAARSLGRSARILKAEVKDMNPDTTTGTDTPAVGPPAVLPPATATTDEVPRTASTTPTPSEPTTPSTASRAAAVDGRTA